jgi:hypothetical protein
LGLSYYSLKRRCQQLGQQAPAAARPTFVELPPASPLARECLVELESADGAKMRIQVRGELLDFAALAERFWSER